jgi:glucose/arabinose dehydrogenase
VGVSANRITLLRDADGDGVAEIREVFLENLNQPFGMVLAVHLRKAVVPSS